MTHRAVLFLFGVRMAASGETLGRRRLAFAAGLIAVFCHVAVTLLFYQIFEPVSPSLTLLAVSFNFAGAADIAVVFHGWYCLLIGCLSIGAVLLPRILGALVTLGGLGSLTVVSPPFLNHLSPYNLAAGILGEGSLCVCLALMGVNLEPSKQLASAPRLVSG